ncbi:MAG: glutaminyl-peptide cyclotransferase [Chitinophagaceae bacterium]
MNRILAFFLLPTLLVACNNQTESDNDDNASAIPPPASLSYAVLKVHPHDTASFTQGLQFLNGFLYEGTGLEGHSVLYKTEIETGKALQTHKLGNEFFGEGITILNDKIYQLTWQNKKGFVYNLPDFKQLSEFTYNIEGWGITNDGTNLIVSDGSNVIYFWNPSTFKEVKRISVQDNTGLRNNLNELEFINGFIYANVWQTNEVLKIAPATGNVVGKIDFSQLKNDYPELKDEYGNNVLNGIAWDSTGNRLFITGKRWSKLFEVRLN